MRGRGLLKQTQQVGCRGGVPPRPLGSEPGPFALSCTASCLTMLLIKELSKQTICWRGERPDRRCGPY